MIFRICRNPVKRNNSFYTVFRVIVLTLASRIVVKGIVRKWLHHFITYTAVVFIFRGLNKTISLVIINHHTSYHTPTYARRFASQILI